MRKVCLLEGHTSVITASAYHVAKPAAECFGQPAASSAATWTRFQRTVEQRTAATEPHFAAFNEHKQSQIP